MAEQTLSETTPAPAAATPSMDPAIKTELDQQMAISLNGGVVSTAAGEPSATAAPESAAAVVAPSDPFGILKERFGYDTQEVALQDIEALRALRANPPVAALQFENVESKRVAEALQAGKFQEVYDVLSQQMQIDRLTTGELTAEMAADLIKFGMQLKHKDLSAADIAWKFNKQYGLPPKPALLPAEDQEEYSEKLAAWQSTVDDKQRELLIDAKLLRPEILAAKSKLVFPTIAQEQDAELIEFKKTIQENERMLPEIIAAYEAMTPKSLEMKLNFKDEPNKIDFDFIYEPDPDSFSKSREMAKDINLFWNNFVTPDGKPDRKKFLETIHFGLNRERILMEAIKQTKNATIKAGLPDNNAGGLVRQLPPTQEPNELDTLMRQSLKGYGGF